MVDGANANVMGSRFFKVRKRSAQFALHGVLTRTHVGRMGSSPIPSREMFGNWRELLGTAREDDNDGVVVLHAPELSHFSVLTACHRPRRRRRCCSFHFGLAFFCRVSSWWSIRFPWRFFIFHCWSFSRSEAEVLVFRRVCCFFFSSPLLDSFSTDNDDDDDDEEALLLLLFSRRFILQQQCSRSWSKAKRAYWLRFGCRVS